MKRFWLYSFALSLGLSGVQHVVAQHPTYNYNTGPSSYPIQAHPIQAPSAAQTANNYVAGQQPYHSATGQQPNNPVAGQQQYNYQTSHQPYYLAAAQDPAVTNGNQAPRGIVPPPVSQPPLPTVPDYSPVPISPPPAANSGSAAMAPQSAAANYSTVAPGCSSCGTTPVGQSYFNGGTHTPYAFSAPSVGWGDQHGCQSNECGAGHFGRGHFGHGNLMGMPCGAKPWFFGGGVLIFRRIDDYNRLLSEDDAGMPILYSEDAALGTMGGFEVMGGRYFNCGRNAIMASYWGLFPENEMITVFDGGAGVRSSIFRPWNGPDPFTGEFQLDQTGTGVGDPLTDEDVYSLFDTASAHRLRRSSEFHNVEINLLGFGVGGASRNFNRATSGSLFSGGHGHHRGGLGTGQFGQYGQGDGNCSTEECGQNDCETCYEAPTRYATGPCCYVAPPCGSRLNFSWLAGIRFMQFNDNFQYSALGVPSLGAETLSYSVYTENQLVGFQVGGRSDLCLGSRLNLYSMARAGIYGNHASLTSSLGTETSFAYESNNPGTVYNIARSTDQLAFLSELGTGLGFRLSSKWTATTGYRAIIASGVATAVGNVRQQGQTIDRTNINAKDYLILHGLDIGAIYNF